MRPLRPPPSLCVSMCACVITMMDGSEPGLLFRFIQGAGPSDYSKREGKACAQHRPVHWDRERAYIDERRDG